MGSQRRPGALDRAIAALAQRQHGVIGWQQLIDLGASPRQIQTRIASARLHRLHRGVYAVGHTLLRIEGHWKAATLAIGEDAVLSHRSAAALHGLLAYAPNRIEVTVPRR